MKNDLSLELLLDLPNKILNASNDNTSYLDLLSDDLVKKYFYSNLRKDLDKVFQKFKDYKYLYSTNENYSLSSSMKNLDNIVVSFNRNNDKVSNYVMKQVDLEIWASDFYNSLLSISNKLTYNEAIYFVDTFFCGKTEEFISEKLLICKASLQKIKKSCLVKVYFELNCYM